MKRRRNDDGTLDRREFLKRGALAGLGVGLLPLASAAASAAAAQPPRVRAYRMLGRTGLRISDISFGGSRLVTGQEDLVRRAFDLGINYFDTAETYTDGESETTSGNALRGRRDKVCLTSKLITSDNQSRQSMMASLEGSLRRLQTDHVDVYFSHAVNNVGRLDNPEWREFTALARKQGKIRFVGMSGHAGRLIECLNHALDQNSVDVILTAYNFGQAPEFYQRFTRGWDFIARQPGLPKVLERAHKMGVGTVAMKTLMGARLNDMRPYETGGATFPQAAFRWVLSNQNVSALIVTMTSEEKIDEYLAASGASTPAVGDIPLLRHYARINSTSSCRYGCDACASACPYGVPISDVMRVRMYARDYGDSRLAWSEYSMLERDAAPCLTCSAHPCAGACPHGLEIDSLGADTHRLLTSIS
jgi:predicted aldo/keto reductase-like oxidoreductase